HLDPARSLPPAGEDLVVLDLQQRHPLGERRLHPVRGNVGDGAGRVTCGRAGGDRTDQDKGRRRDLDDLHDSPGARDDVFKAVRVPIWFTFTSTALPTPSAMPRARISGFVTKRSSPTSCTLEPRAAVKAFHPGQSFSPRPSSMETIG